MAAEQNKKQVLHDLRESLTHFSTNGDLAQRYGWWWGDTALTEVYKVVHLAREIGAEVREFSEDSEYLVKILIEAHLNSVLNTKLTVTNIFKVLPGNTGLDIDTVLVGYDIKDVRKGTIIYPLGRHLKKMLEG